MSYVIILSMSIIKHGKVRKIFHDAGIKRISPGVIAALDQAFEDVIEKMAEQCMILYPDMLIETHEMVRISEAQDGWKIRVDSKALDIIDINDLVKEIEMPDVEDVEDADAGEEGGE